MLLTTTTITIGQKIDIHELTNNHGLFAIKLGTAETITSHKNLDKYDENGKAIGNSIKMFCKINGFNDLEQK